MPFHYIVPSSSTVLVFITISFDILTEISSEKYFWLFSHFEANTFNNSNNGEKLSLDLIMYNFCPNYQKVLVMKTPS